VAKILPWRETPLVSSGFKSGNSYLKNEVVMRHRLSLHAMTLFLGLLNASLCLAQGAGPLVLEKEIALPGVEGRIDHFSGDVPNQRLFVAALENGSVEILDIRRGERTAEIKGLEEPQGVYYDFKTGRLYVATGGDGKLRIYDGKSLTVQEALDFGGDDDNVRYDEQTGDIWVGYGNGGIAIANAAVKMSAQSPLVPILNPSSSRQTEIAFTSMSRDNSASVLLTGKSVRFSLNGDQEAGSETSDGFGTRIKGCL
jgi:hypothetical protein